jgi:hypothetical protein
LPDACLHEKMLVLVDSFSDAEYRLVCVSLYVLHHIS